MRTIVNISLPEEMAKQIKKESKESGFATTSEFIRHLIRIWNTEKLSKIIKKGDAEYNKGKTQVIRSFSEIK